MNKKLVVWLSCLFVLSFAFLNYTFADSKRSKYKAYNNAFLSMEKHVSDNDLSFEPLKSQGACSFYFRDFTATSDPWRWDCSVGCGIGGAGLCKELFLVTLWCNDEYGDHVVSQHCVNSVKTCQTYSNYTHIGEINLWPDFPDSYTPGTYWLNVGLWGGTCGNPSHILIASRNSPTVVVAH